jgi:hypothetical protein
MDDKKAKIGKDAVAVGETDADVGDGSVVITNADILPPGHKAVAIGAGAVAYVDDVIVGFAGPRQHDLVIWKYPIDLAFEIKIKMPKAAHIVYLGQQRESLCIWILCDPDADMETRAFRIYGTGISIPPGWTYVGTAIFEDGAYVWHLFEGE